MREVARDKGESVLQWEINVLPIFTFSWHSQGLTSQITRQETEFRFHKLLSSIIINLSCIQKSGWAGGEQLRDFHDGIYAFLNHNSPHVAQINSAPWPFKDTLKCNVLKKMNNFHFSTQNKILYFYFYFLYWLISYTSIYIHRETTLLYSSNREGCSRNCASSLLMKWAWCWRCPGAFHELTTRDTDGRKQGDSEQPQPQLNVGRTVYICKAELQFGKWILKRLNVLFIYLSFTMMPSFLKSCSTSGW